jgi:hypothetical protein
MRSTSVKFGEGELDAFRAAADAAGLKFNAWVRRACRGAAELEAAVALEQESWVQQPSVVVDVAFPPARAFTPDFK